MIPPKLLRTHEFINWLYRLNAKEVSDEYDLGLKVGQNAYAWKFKILMEYNRLMSSTMNVGWLVPARKEGDLYPVPTPAQLAEFDSCERDQAWIRSREVAERKVLFVGWSVQFHNEEWLNVHTTGVSILASKVHGIGTLEDFLIDGEELRGGRVLLPNETFWKEVGLIKE